ncbi:unnamed protein product [Leptosia nina]|uniref:Alpha-ketoglutarate-dependent dioxygenase AlkB-like domain-containing protein n=1 Tax=Leptosia nina TaxID=320188 RepID=A0AAV1JVM6_9NEOP
MRYQLENLAKTRLARYIEDTEKQIKEKRCQYVSFQQLYLATYQENVFLKTRVRKLTKERDNAKKNLVSLINEVCRSKNKELKAFCCQFIVESKENFMKSDVKNEIRQFLKNHTARNQDVLKDEGNNNNLTDIIEQDCLILSEAPRLRGLPGEYVWTVKDKDGLIEKLYECNLQTDCDNGDTIRRIRQYSVYHDQDCLLDYSCSRTFVTDVCQSSGTHMVGNVKCVNYPITRKRFLTGSHAFQKFLEEVNVDHGTWKSIKDDGLDLEYSVLIPGPLASDIFNELEETLEYFSGNLSKIKVFGKIYPLPRRQVAYGDPGITYTFSNLTVPALPWPAPVLSLRDFLFKLRGIKYNFVLVNKYRDGNDHMGEHRDNEPELDPNVPIASMSFGEDRM